MRCLVAPCFGLALVAAVCGCRSCHRVESELRARELDVLQLREDLDRCSVYNQTLQHELRSLRGEMGLGPDGQPQKSEVAAMPQSSGGGHEGRLKEHVKEKKKEEFQEYGQQLAALAHQYAQPDPARLQQAFQQGNLTLGPSGAPGEIRMVIKNYIKPNDSVTLVVNQQTKAMQSIQVASYLTDPKDAVKISTQFAQLPDGTNHVDNMTVNGVSKNLTVATQNSDYQKL